MVTSELQDRVQRHLDTLVSDGTDTPADLPDWSKVCDALAAAEPRWPPGAAMGYHSYTFGYLVGELARRATGQPMRSLLREWITEPLGIPDQLYHAVPRTALPDLARLDQGAPAGQDDPDAILTTWESRPAADFGNTAEILCADIPSVATCTAHALATMFNGLLHGELVDALELARMSALAYQGEDLVFESPARMALGFPIGRIGAPAEEHSVVFGWPGGGGSYAYADPVSGIAFALTKTRIAAGFGTVLTIIDILQDKEQNHVHRYG